MKEMALYIMIILIMAGLAISNLDTDRLNFGNNRQMTTIKDTKGSSDQRGVGAPLIEEFENQIN